MSNVVVLDCGSHSTKVGFSGESLPRVVFPSLVGHDARTGTRHVGAKAVLRRGAVELLRPVVGGRIQMWEEVEEVSNSYNVSHILSGLGFLFL